MGKKIEEIVEKDQKNWEKKQLQLQKQKEPEAFTNEALKTKTVKPSAVGMEVHTNPNDIIDGINKTELLAIKDGVHVFDIKEVDGDIVTYDCMTCGIEGIRSKNQKFVIVKVTAENEKLINECKAADAGKRRAVAGDLPTSRDQEQRAIVQDHHGMTVSKQSSIKISSSVFQFIDISKITESRTNQRRNFNETEIKELAESIKSYGILQPLTIRKNSLNPASEYELVFGARRLRAAKIAGLNKVPVLIREFTDEQVMEVQLIENLQRKDIHPMDEAIGYQSLLNSGKYTVEALAEKIGKSEKYVYTRLRLNQLINEFVELFEKDLITFAVARVICRQTKEFQKKIYDEFEGDNWNNIKDMEEEDLKSLNPSTIEEFIKDNVYQDLKNAPFDLKDAKLDVRAAACVDCHKNTACSNQLFPEYSKDKFCTDPKCFNEKMKLHLAAETKKLIDKKEEFIPISTAHQIDKDLKDKGIIDTNHYTICKKTDPGAKKALIVDINNYDIDKKKLGNVVYISTAKDAPGSQSEERKKDLQKKRADTRKEQAELNARFTVIEDVSEKAAMLFKDRDLLFPEGLFILCKIAIMQISHDSLVKICKFNKWEVPAEGGTFNTNYRDYDGFVYKQLKKVEPDDLIKFYFKLVLWQKVEFYDRGVKADALEYDPIKSFAKIFNIDIKKAEKEQLELLEPKKEEKKKAKGVK
jgi:ParB family chromosome partitioning protein